MTPPVAEKSAVGGGCLQLCARTMSVVNIKCKLLRRGDVGQRNQAPAAVQDEYLLMQASVGC